MRVRTAADLGHLIRSYRVAAGLSQAELAKMANTKQPWISEVESGKPTVGVGRVLHLLALLEAPIEIPLPGQMLDTTPDNSDLEYPDLHENSETPSP